MFYGNYAMQLQHEKVHLLERIANHLIINSSFLDDLGLFHGKMGIVIFFYHYSRYTNNPIYEEFAGELLDEVYEDIHRGMSFDFENGLCGIGWGIEYLLQNGYIEGDSDEILEDIDRKIMEYDPRRITDTTFRSGFPGLSCYIRTRLNSPCRNPDTVPFDALYLSGWENIPDNSEEWQGATEQILIRISGTFPPNKNITDGPPGLENGCAGYGLNILLK